MNHQVETIRRELEKLLEGVQLERVDLKLTTLDKDVEEFAKSFNLISSLKPCSDDSFESPATILLDAYQSPFLVYKTEAGHYRVLSGLLTFQKLCKAKYAKNVDSSVPCLILSRRPKAQLRRLILMNDVVRPLLKEFVDISADTINYTLPHLFTSVDQQSVFFSPEWQSLFPSIKTKTELCRWLHISTKSVKLK
ncbi:hypothetical protein [Shewanella baltica]|uniref:hypothetical protein n=1 Tax=Shewanella baltica TaxID=62322 RepID=UPI000E05455A|nr:hypothetical protein [Shewanella baltica]SUI56551.1 Uncharacterised protein [Shewanella baltica]